MASISEIRPFAARVSVPARAVLLAAFVAAAPVAGEGASYRDAVGRAVEVAEEPQRIVSLAPNLTEILFALGLRERVAGVTTFCDWPPEAQEKPKVGGFINPSLEKIVSLRPDLVLATADGNRESDVLRLEQLGVAVYVTDSRSLGQVVQSVQAVGHLTGTEDEARRLADALERRRRAVREAVSGVPPRSVFVALDTLPLITAGKGTFVDQLVEEAGGRNVVASGAVKYPVYSLEALMAADPEVIVVATGREGDDSAAAWEKSSALSALRARRSDRVYRIADGSFFRPGPRIIDTLERLAALLHPEAFR